jgi:hypothetical protein
MRDPEMPRFGNPLLEMLLMALPSERQKTLL